MNVYVSMYVCVFVCVCLHGHERDGVSVSMFVVFFFMLNYLTATASLCVYCAFRGCESVCVCVCVYACLCVCLQMGS